MESRIEELLTKYWEGNTSVQEEKLLKDYLRKNQLGTTLSQYSNELHKTTNMEPPSSFKHPGKKQRSTWLSIAASIMLGVSVAFWVINDAQQQRDYVIEDPEEAYLMTRKALFMVSATLNEGASYSEPLTKINEVQDLIKETKGKKQ